MDKNSPSYVILFAMGMCVVLSVLLSASYGMLKPTIDANKEFDRQKNVLKAVGLYDPATDAEVTRAQLEQTYKDRIESLIVKRETGEFVEKSATELAAELKTDSKIRDFRQRTYLEVYRQTNEAGETVAWCLPTLAYGLWSWLDGFMAVTPDGREVVGITYYQHGETPGLGGEVDNPTWQKQWEGKQLFDAKGRLVSVTVKKGNISPDIEAEQLHMVDGLSGATITSNGVSRDTKTNLEAFQPFFVRQR